MFDFLQFKTIDDILLAAGYIIALTIGALRVALGKPRNKWRDDFLVFVAMFFVLWAFLNYVWWFALVWAMVMSAILHLVYMFFANRACREMAEVASHFEIPENLESFNNATFRNDEAVVQDISVSIQANETESRGKPLVNQTLLYCLHCGSALSGAICKTCGYDHTKKVLLLNRIDPRKLQLSKK